MSGIRHRYTKRRVFERLRDEMTLPYSDAIFICVFPRECTEAFQEGHCRAFEFFGGARTLDLDTTSVCRVESVGDLRIRARYVHRRVISPAYAARDLKGGQQ